DRRGAAARMTRLLGYVDKITVEPGDSLAVMVSCVGAPSYRAELVRLLSPNAGPNAPPFRQVVVPSPINREHKGRAQELHGGSWAVGPEVPRLGSFTIQAMVWPTTPSKGRQPLLGTWSEAAGAGFGLMLDESGALELRIGDGAGGIFKLTSGQPLLMRKWY